MDDDNKSIHTPSMPGMEAAETPPLAKPSAPLRLPIKVFDIVEQAEGICLCFGRRENGDILANRGNVFYLHTATNDWAKVGEWEVNEFRWTADITMAAEDKQLKAPSAPDLCLATAKFLRAEYGEGTA